jgi:pyruvate dehydrogenase E1 component alpha subunit
MSAIEDIRPATIEGLPADLLLEWLSMMLLIRQFEDALEPLAMSGKIPAGAHLASGQEAVAVGAVGALAEGDVVATAHRPHHHALAKGLSPKETMAELYGRATGTSGGRGGSMHLADFSRGYLPGNAIVGANVGIAMGAALAAKMSGRTQIACALFGDGALNTGRTWEALNMAASWKLPLVAICENNLYAVETLTGAVSGSGTGVDRARAFGLESEQVDGQDVGAMYLAVMAARERAIAGDGPTFIEALTYRFHGHSTGEKPVYRTAEEVDRWRRTNDPIQRLRLALTREDLITDERYEQLLAEADGFVAEATRFAEDSEPPPLTTVAEGVYGIAVAVKGNPR